MPRRSTLAQERVRSALVGVGQIPLGGTATGTGLNTHPQFAQRVRARLKKDSGLKQIAAPLDPFEAQANRDALVELSGAFEGAGGVVDEDRERSRVDGLGSLCGHRGDLDQAP